jgi:hypothetical protein
MKTREQEAIGTIRRDATELDDEELEGVSGGTGFLDGSLMAEGDATPWVGAGTGSHNGFIMKDSIIVRTGR